MSGLSDEHKQARVGNATASRIHDVVTKLKSGGWSAAREKYLTELVIERMTNTPYDNAFFSKQMQWGNDQEDAAITTYGLGIAEEITRVGYVPHPRIEHAGASPDALVGATGCAQIKCPDSHTHHATLRGGAIDASYLSQMQWEMACTGRHWCDFISYDPRWPVKHQMAIRRVRRDDFRIAEMEQIVSNFLADVAVEVARMKS